MPIESNSPSQPLDEQRFKQLAGPKGQLTSREQVQLFLNSDQRLKDPAAAAERIWKEHGADGSVDWSEMGKAIAALPLAHEPNTPTTMTPNAKRLYDELVKLKNIGTFFQLQDALKAGKTAELEAEPVVRAFIERLVTEFDSTRSGSFLVPRVVQDLSKLALEKHGASADAWLVPLLQNPKHGWDIRVAIAVAIGEGRHFEALYQEAAGDKSKGKEWRKAELRELQLTSARTEADQLQAIQALRPCLRSANKPSCEEAIAALDHFLQKGRRGPTLVKAVIDEAMSALREAKDVGNPDLLRRFLFSTAANHNFESLIDLNQLPPRDRVEGISILYPKLPDKKAGASPIAPPGFVDSTAKQHRQQAGRLIETLPPDKRFDFWQQAQTTHHGEAVFRLVQDLKLTNLLQETAQAALANAKTAATPAERDRFLRVAFGMGRVIPLENLRDPAKMTQEERLAAIASLAPHVGPGTPAAKSLLQVLERVPDAKAGQALWKSLEAHHLTEHLYGLMDLADYDRIYPKLVAWQVVPDVRGRKKWDAAVQAEYGRFAAVLANEQKVRPVESDCKTMALWLRHRFCQKMQVPEWTPPQYAGYWRDESRILINKVDPKRDKHLRPDYATRKDNLVTGPNMNFVPHQGKHWINVPVLANSPLMVEQKQRDGKPIIRFERSKFGGDSYRIDPTRLRPGDVMLLDSGGHGFHHTINVANVKRNEANQVVGLTLVVGTFDDMKDRDRETAPQYPYINYHSEVREIALDPLGKVDELPVRVWDTDTGYEENDFGGQDFLTGHGKIKIMNWRSP